MNKVKVSVLTVCLNAEKTIARTIESVLNQSCLPYEYFVIDGKSSDKTVEIAKRYSNDFLKKKINYHIISEKDNGMYDALNKGAKLAKGELVGQINSDDWYEPFAIQKMSDLYEKTGFDMAYADIRMIQSSGKSWIKEARVDKFVNSRHWNHPTQFTRRELLIKKPYACKCMSDDLDFMLWVRSNNYHVETLDKVLANFTIEGMSHSKSLKSAMNRIKTKTEIYKQNGYSVVHGIDVAVTEIGKMMLE